MEHFLGLLIQGFMIGAGVCFGTVVFEWTRRAFNASIRATFRFLGWAFNWGKTPKFMKRV